MTNEELLAETSIRLNETGEDFYKDMRLVLLKYLQDDKGPEYDLNVLIGTARTCCSGFILRGDKESATYFLYALNFLYSYRCKKIEAELKELQDYQQDMAWEADLANDS